MARASAQLASTSATTSQGTHFLAEVFVFDEIDHRRMTARYKDRGVIVCVISDVRKLQGMTQPFEAVDEPKRFHTLHIVVAEELGLV